MVIRNCSFFKSIFGSCLTGSAAGPDYRNTTIGEAISNDSEERDCGNKAGTQKTISVAFVQFIG